MLTKRSQHREQIEIGAADQSNLTGTVDFTFLGYTTTLKAFPQSSEKCEESWEALDNVEEVDCNATSYGGYVK